MAGNNQDPNSPGSPGELQEPGRQVDGAPPASPPAESVTPQADSAPATPPVPESQQETPVPPRTDWRDRRIGELTARGREMRAEIERLKAANAGQQPQPNGDLARAPNGQFRQPAGYQGPGGPPDQAEIDRQIQQRAEMLAANQEFNRRCNEVAEIGRRNYPDFDGQVGKLVGLVDANDPQGVASYNNFLNAAMETGEASKIIHALGGDLDEASRILSLTPVRMAVELTRMAAKPISELSRAPRPINPAATNAQQMRTSISPDDPGSDQMSTEEWMRRRNEQIAARGVRR